MQYQEGKNCKPLRQIQEIKAVICSAMGADPALAAARDGRVKEGSIVLPVVRDRESLPAGVDLETMFNGGVSLWGAPQT